MNENLTNQIVAALLKDGTVKMTGEEIATAIAPAVAALPKEYRFMGVATPDLSPGKIFVPTLYVAVADGWYTGFSKNQMNEGQIVFFTSDDGRVWAQTTAYDPAPAPRPEPPAPDPMLSQPLTFEATEDSTTVKFAVIDGNISDAKTIEISTDDGTTWTEKTASEEGTLLATLNSGDKVMLRGNNSAYANDVFYHCFDVSAPVYVYGNIMSMIGGADFSGLKTIEEPDAFRLFLCAEIDSWVLSKDGSNLVLPATTLSESCYVGLLSDNMSLIKAPVLPARVVPKDAYRDMFYNCESLSYVECLAEDISAVDSTTNWLDKVADSGTFIKADNMNDWTEGADGIPSGWTVRNESDPTPTTGLKVIVSTADWAQISGEGVTASTKAEAAQIAGITEDELDFLLNGGDLTPCLFVFGANGGAPNNYSYYTRGVQRGHSETGGVGFSMDDDSAPAAALEDGVYTIRGWGE